MAISAQRQSPCIQVCQMNLQTGFCAGCFRTQEEIARWLRYSDTERDAVLGKLGARRADFFSAGGEINFSPYEYE